MVKAESSRRFWPSFLLGACAAVLAAAAWLSLSSPPPAFGQLPDSGAQRVEMIKELREGNRKLAEIAGLLREIRDDARRGKSAKPGGAPQRKHP